MRKEAGRRECQARAAGLPGMNPLTSSRFLSPATLLAALPPLAALALVVIALRLPSGVQVVLPPAAEPAAAPGEPRGFTVAGTATLQAVPDVADLRATLAVEHSSPKEATRRVRALEGAASGALRTAGVEPDALSLSQLRLDAVHDPKTGRVVRYRAAVSLTVVTRDFTRLAPLMEVLGEAGATSLSTAFRVSDLPALKKKVRQMAARAAREKADELAAAVGFELGRVRAVVESAGEGWQWNGVYANAVAVQEAPQVAHGDLQPITLTVSVTYDMADRS